MDHPTGKVLAYVCGRRKDDVFLQRQQLLAPCGVTTFYPDGWGAYARHLDAAQHQVGKEPTQKIESTHSKRRTRIKRLVRRTLGFSKTDHMHDLVIGRFINRYALGLPLGAGINTCETSSAFVVMVSNRRAEGSTVCSGCGGARVG